MNKLTNEAGLLVSIYQELFLQFAKVSGGTIQSFNTLLCIGIILVGLYITKGSPTKKKVQRKAPNNKDREYGHWMADHTFTTPTPPPFKNWSHELTKPLPYRAFKHNYHVTMGIRNMDWASWFELDNEWMKYHEEKVRRIKTRGTELYETSPKATEAAWELLDEMTSYLPNRYPSMFKREGTTIENLVTKEIFELDRSKSTEDPILMCAKMVQDDLAIIIEHEDGNYSLESGAIILAGFWRFRDKFQMKLNEIHTSGDVPKFNEKLKPGMTRFFQRLTLDKPVVRNNYFIQTDDNLGWSSSIGDEDVKEVGWNTAQEATNVDQLYFRSERQSLRRLPKSGAVVFTIRTYFVPMVKLCKEPYIPRRLLDGINSWTEDVKEYKGYAKYKDALLPYLEKRALEQEQGGLAPADEPNVYPF